MGVLVQTGMAIESKAFDIWRRLYTRFSLEPGPLVEGGLPEVSTSIIPTTNVDELLQQGRALISDDMDLSGGTTLTIPGFTVPTGERWKLYRLWRSGTIVASRVRIVDPRNSDIILTSPSIPEEVINFGAPFTLEEGWIIGMQETGNAGDSAETMHVLITSEEAF